MTTEYSDLQLDALRELANVASGTAATALSQMLGREVGLSVPNALVLPLADAVDAVGPPDETVSGIVLPLAGDLQALVLLLIPLEDAETLCRLLGVEPGSEVGDSALGEIGNILGASYLGAMSAMTGLEILPSPPHLVTDLLGAIVASLLAETSAGEDLALVLESELDLSGEACSLSFMLLPVAGGVGTLLAPLGLAESGI